MLSVERIEIRAVTLPLAAPFETSFARETHKECLLVRCQNEGAEGWGEVSAMSAPLYNEETLQTCWHLLRDFLGPHTLHRSWNDPAEWAASVAHFRRNYMAKAGLEAALWDLHSAQTRTPLATLWGGTRQNVEVGISLGIENSLAALLPQIEQGIAEGYRRVELKINPGWDVQVVREVCRLFPDLTLQVDANSAYRLSDAPLLQRLDEFNLLLIEQPLDHDDIVDHAALQKLLKAPICLDESIDTVEQCRRALSIGAGRIINIKPARMGGYHAARQTHDLCAARGVPCWVGGMLETGVGRLQNLALASLPNFTLPGDLSASRRYFARDIIEPEVELKKDGTVEVPSLCGVADRLQWPTLEASTLHLETFFRAKRSF